MKRKTPISLILKMACLLSILHNWRKGYFDFICGGHHEIYTMGPYMHGAAILMVILLTKAPRCFAYKPGGFISIDCGSSKKEYVDPHTNLTWDGDGKYMLSGENAVIPNISATDASTSENSLALMDFRYFPVKRQKYCYELPLTNDSTTYLLRAMFLHGGSPQLHSQTRFTIYVNATLWSEIELAPDSVLGEKFLHYTNYETVIVEGIFFNPGTYVVNVCLVPDVGIPFISSLELRELDYKGVIYFDYLSDGRWGQNLFLRNLYRVKMGRESTSLRYPDDQFDRIWSNYNSSDAFFSQPYLPQARPAHPLHVNASDMNINLTMFNNLPRKVMEFGMALDKDGPFSTFLVLPSSENARICFIVYLHSNYSSQASPVPTNITAAGMTESPKSISTFSVHSLYSTVTYPGYYSLTVHSPSNLPLDLVALEVYEERPFNTRATLANDGRFVNFLKANWNLSDWQGDPCLPVPNDWLTCYGSSYFLTSIKLSYIPNSKSLLDFKHDNSSSLYLSNVSLTHSEVNDGIWFFLSEILDTQSLVNLNLSYNQIKDFWNSSNWSSTKFNRSEDEGVGLQGMAALDISHNFISRVPLPSELEFLFNYDDSTFLQTLNISNNAMYGEFPFVWISSISTFELLNADNNLLFGSLNLTIWYQELQQVLSSKVDHGSSNGSIFNQLFSFLNNNITTIIPDVDDFEYSLNTSLLIQKFNTNSGGILLYGNPYCTNANSLFQRYMCRNSTSDRSYESRPSRKSKVPFFVGIFGGVLLLIVGFIGIITILRLRKKVKVLQSFQQELLNRNIQPPFFSYQDLRIATRDFHNDNKLGSGGFGAVYKGVFPGKTTVAVKKLHVKEKLQKEILNDFLNEVVLLTGIKHKNLVQLLGCCLNNKERILVYEYVNRGNLAKALWGHEAQRNECLDWKQRVNICLGVARGLSYLHEELQPRIIHRDIKALNVLVDKNFNPKIADFGLAKSFQDEETRVEFTAFAGTKGYLAPEYILDGLLTEKADIYSFGILVLEILSGRKCVDLNQSQNKAERVYIKYWAEELQRHGNVLELLDPKMRGQCPEEEVKKVIEIALLCLDKEHKQRPSMSQVVIMLATELTDKTLMSHLHKTKATNQKNLMRPLEVDSDGSYNDEVEKMPLRGWGKMNTDEEKTQSTNERSKKDALMPSEESNLSYSNMLTSGEESLLRSSSIRSKTRAILQRVGSKLSKSYHF